MIISRGGLLVVGVFKPKAVRNLGKGQLREEQTGVVPVWGRVLGTLFLESRILTG